MKPLRLYSPTTAPRPASPGGGQRVNEGPQPEWEGYGLLVAQTAQRAAVRTLGETVSNVYECVVRLPGRLRPAAGWRIESPGRDGRLDVFEVAEGVAEPADAQSPWNLPLRKVA